MINQYYFKSYRILFPRGGFCYILFKFQSSILSPDLRSNHPHQLSSNPLLQSSPPLPSPPLPPSSGVAKILVGGGGGGGGGGRGANVSTALYDLVI